MFHESVSVIEGLGEVAFVADFATAVVGVVGQRQYPKLSGSVAMAVHATFVILQ